MNYFEVEPLKYQNHDTEKEIEKEVEVEVEIEIEIEVEIENSQHISGTYMILGS